MGTEDPLGIKIVKDHLPASAATRASEVETVLRQMQLSDRNAQIEFWERRNSSAAFCVTVTRSSTASSVAGWKSEGDNRFTQQFAGETAHEIGEAIRQQLAS